MLNIYRKKINSLKTIKADRQQQLVNADAQIKIAEQELNDNERVREIFKKASLLTQNKLAGHINSIVTKTLRTVFFEKEVDFVAEFVERRNKTECDLYVVEDGHRYDLLDDRGHGMADLASMALRVAYISLDTVDNVLILDEPFRNLNKARQPYAAELIKELSRELDMQFIISTHISGLIEHADKNIRVRIKDGVTSVK